VLEELPSAAELDQHASRISDVIPAGAGPVAACQDFTRGRPTAVFSEDPSTPVRWGDVLDRYCEQRAEWRAWENAEKSRQRPPYPVAVHALTGEERPDRALLWSTWARALDGRFHRPPLPRDGSRRPLDAEQLLIDARNVHTGVPVGGLTELARDFRPHLLFDTHEEFYPVDVDRLLTGDRGHQACDRENNARDECEKISAPASLTASDYDYIDFAGGARLGRDLRGQKAGPARMYVHVREERGRLYLDYWWYYIFNTSPWRSEVNCLPGLTLHALSCHDHEGDWEGVTVILDVKDDQETIDRYDRSNVTPESAVYSAHSHRVRWPWASLEHARDEGADEATHPLVYVAAGSHASYPTGCVGRDRCNQELALEGLGDGSFDGERDWPYNDRDDCRRTQCLIALPSTRDGRQGVLWNAFPGTWGAAYCIPVGKVCSLVDGPPSPSSQKRFQTPWDADEPPRDQLRRFRERYRRDTQRGR
jgi:hypothetical protein